MIRRIKACQQIVLTALLPYREHHQIYPPASLIYVYHESQIWPQIPAVNNLAFMNQRLIAQTKIISISSSRGDPAFHGCIYLIWPRAAF